MEKRDKLLCGERLRALRAQKGLTQEETAERLNISLRYYQMLERGEKLGSIDVLIAACELLGCSLDYLLRGRLGEGDDPIAVRLNGLTPQRRADAAKILDLMIKSWEDS